MREDLTRVILQRVQEIDGSVKERLQRIENQLAAGQPVFQLFNPHFSSPVVARRRKGRPGKACDRGLRSRTCTVRRGGRPSETQPGRMIAAT